jgi:hypothetical protein
MGAAAMLIILIFGSIGMFSRFTPAVVAFENSYCFNNIIQLTFSAASFAYAASFATEWQNRFVRLVVIRSNPMTYALSKCVVTGLSGGASIAVGACVFIIYACIASPSIMPNEFYDVAMFTNLAAGSTAIPFFLAYLYVIFLQGMFFSVLGLLSSGYFPNKYVAYAAPFTLAFAINQVAQVLNLPNWIDPVKLAMARLYDFSSVKALLIETGMFLLYTVICSALFVRIVKRRVQNG